MFGCRFTGREAAFCHLLNHMQAAGEGNSGMPMGVHPVGLLEDWVFGDFQSLKPTSDEHRTQPIGASHLAVARKLWKSLKTLSYTLCQRSRNVTQ